MSLFVHHNLECIAMPSSLDFCKVFRLRFGLVLVELKREEAASQARFSPSFYCFFSSGITLFTREESMKSVITRTVVMAGSYYTLGATPIWGQRPLPNDTNDASKNTASGNPALFANTTGADNTAVGNGALTSNGVCLTPRYHLVPLCQSHSNSPCTRQTGAP